MMKILKNHFYLNETFHHPPDFKQLLIIMYKDIITNLKIPGIYILMNGKSEKLYDIIFIINIITENKTMDINVFSFVTYTEKALINIIQRIVCFFHYNQDILRNINYMDCIKKKIKKQVI